MKGIAFLFALLALTAPAAAQEQIVAGGGLESGGFGALAVKLSDVADDFEVFVGARVGWIINHTFVIGAGGYGLASDNRAVAFGYGGLELEYINRSGKPLHYSVYTLVGGGGVKPLFGDTDGVFVVESSASV